MQCNRFNERNRALELHVRPAGAVDSQSALTSVAAAEAKVAELEFAGSGVAVGDNGNRAAYSAPSEPRH